MSDKFLTMAEGRALKKAIMCALDDVPDPISARSLRALETIYRVIDNATLYGGEVTDATPSAIPRRADRD